MTSLIVCESNSCFPNKYIHSFIRKQEKNDQYIKVISVKISTVGQIREINLHIWNIATFYKP